MPIGAVPSSQQRPCDPSIGLARLDSCLLHAFSAPLAPPVYHRASAVRKKLGAPQGIAFFGVLEWPALIGR